MISRSSMLLQIFSSKPSKESPNPGGSKAIYFIPHLTYLYRKLYLALHRLRTPVKSESSFMRSSIND
jgi:hypothetical protein